MISSFIVQVVRPDFFEQQGPLSLGPNLEKPDFIGDPLAWSRVLGNVERLSVAWPLLRAIDAAPWKHELDPLTRADVSERLSRHQFLNALAEEELGHSLTVLGAARIPVALLGGADAASLYPEPSIRLFRSVELLVREQDFQAALRALGSGGYRVAARRGPERVDLARSTKGMRIKLCTRVRQSAAKAHAMTLLWARCSERVLPSVCARVSALSSEDRILGGILLSLKKQLWLSSPVASNDLHYAIVRGGKIAWTEILRQSHAEGALAGSWAVLNFLKGRWGTPLPSGLLEELGREISPFRRRILSRIDPPKSWLLEQPQYLETHFSPWQALKLGLGLST